MICRTLAANRRGPVRPVFLAHSRDIWPSLVAAVPCLKKWEKGGDMNSLTPKVSSGQAHMPVDSLELETCSFSVQGSTFEARDGTETCSIRSGLTPGAKAVSHR